MVVSDFVTIGVLIGLEGLLSADNALVIAVMVLGLPKREHRAALHYGLVGAFAFRIAATVLAVYLIKLGWVKLAGAAKDWGTADFVGGSASAARRESCDAGSRRGDPGTTMGRSPRAHRPSRPWP